MSKPVDMACVVIGFESYLLPAAAALKVVTLMKDAFQVERDFSMNEKFQVSDRRPRIEMAIVRADQVVMPESLKTPRSPRSRPLLSQG